MQPDSPLWRAPDVRPPPPRGALGLLVGLRLVGSVFFIVLLIIAAGLMQRLAAQGVDGAAAAHKKLLFLTFLVTLELVFVTGIWMWKKWGVYGVALLSVFGVVVGLSGTAMSKVGSMTGLVFDVLLMLLIAARWTDFE